MDYTKEKKWNCKSFYNVTNYDISTSKECWFSYMYKKWKTTMIYILCSTYLEAIEGNFIQFYSIAMNGNINKTRKWITHIEYG